MLLYCTQLQIEKGIVYIFADNIVVQNMDAQKAKIYQPGNLINIGSVGHNSLSEEILSLYTTVAL